MKSDIKIDPWSWLDYKPAMNHRNDNRFPSWVGDHWRRLQAYLFYDMYYRNVSNHLTDQPLSEQETVREYGDFYIMVEQIMASLIGEDYTLVVPDADQSLGEDGETQSGLAAEWQTLLDEWARKEKFELKLLECERNAVKMGDGVYVLGWSTTKNRPVLRSYDPGFFFPVWSDDRQDEEFPSKLHLAYEYQSAKDPKKWYIRRITYELRSTDPGGEITVPWRQHAVNVSCFMSDGIWEKGGSKADLDDLSDATAQWRISADGTEVRDVNLGIDFIPVVHMPNTTAGEEFWGQSSIGSTMQILDDLKQSDTGLMAASEIASTPIISVQTDGGQPLPTNEAGQVLGYKKGTVYETNGPMSHLDMSRSLDAAMKFGDRLLERLSINGRIPESLLGRIKPSDVPSGISLWLSFAPHSGMIGEMRKVRRDKYSLLLKYVARFYQQNSVLGQGEIPHTEIRFGSYLPADRKETLDMVAAASNAKNPFMSLAQRVRILQEAGFPVEDIEGELAAIQREDVEGAGKIVDATGDLNAARERLGFQDIAEELDNEIDDF